MQIKLKSKRIQAIIVLAIAALLVMAGTFAWYSFSQQRINTFNIVSAPNVNLHDDFAGGPEKDVYVENSGQQPALVRVRLTELLSQNGVLMPEGAVDDETAANWHVHTPSQDACEVCEFKAHEYFSWTMNGHKFYMPAPVSAKGLKTDDEYIEPLAVGDLDAIIDYAELLQNAFKQIYAADEETLATVLGYIDEYLGGSYANAEELQAAIAKLDNSYTVEGVRQYDGQTDELIRYLKEVRLTLIPDKIITMQDWIDGITHDGEPHKKGNFWVVDEDGWCYWANALNAGEATGQLLSSVDNIKNYSGELTYRINVVLNATTFEGTELSDFFETAQTNGGISANAKMLMTLVSGFNVNIGDKFSINANGEMADGSEYTAESVTLGENDVVYIGVGDGVFFVPVDDNGNPDASSKQYAVTYPGTDDKHGTDDDIGPIRSGDVLPQWYLVNIEDVTGGDAIEAGQKGTLVRANTLEDMLTYSVDPKAYRVQAFERGVNEQFYFKLSEDMYAVALDESGNPENPSAMTYYIVYPSAEGGDIGTEDDIYSHVVPVERRYFYHIGSGVYVEVENSDSEVTVAETEGSLSHVGAIDYPNTTYYFSNKIFESPDGALEINDEDGVPLAEKLDTTFCLTLHIGEKFGYYDEPETGISTVYKGAEMIHHQTVVGDIARTFTMKKIYKHTDGKLYIQTDYVKGEDGQQHEDFLGYFIKGMGDNGEFGVQFLGVMVKLVGGVMTVPQGLPSMGDGTLDKPFQIRSRSEMDWVLSEIADGNTFEGEYLVVTKDFSMGVRAFTPIGMAGTPFRGTFDGAGFTIKDLKITGNADSAGLFGNVGANGKVQNLSLDNVSATGNNYVGGIVGVNLGEIEECHVLSGTVTGVGIFVGGIAGSNEGSIQESINKSAVAGNAAPGGITGRNTGTGTVSDCENAGTVKGTNLITGGVVAQNYGTIENCNNTAVITGGNYVGGVAGYNVDANSFVSRCTNSGAVNGKSYVGGVVGTNNVATARVEDSSNTGDVTGIATSNNIGGVVGNNVGKLTACFNTGGVTANSLSDSSGGVGGVAGLNSGTIERCYANLADGKKVYSGGNISATPIITYSGGIVGTNSGTIKNCYMWGNVESQDKFGFVGGAIGTNMGGSISNVYHTKGTVYGATAGGIVNTQAGTMKNVVALSDKVTTVGANGGRFATSNSGTLTDCYFWSSMPVSIVGATVTSGTAINPNTNRPTESWWDSTVGFNATGGWRWDSTNSLPVLQDVTP